ncbi:MAG: hypothetical protein AAFX79_12695 [Planctomycetota bacterium]
MSSFSAANSATVLASTAAASDRARTVQESARRSDRAREASATRQATDMVVLSAEAVRATDTATDDQRRPQHEQQPNKHREDGDTGTLIDVEG